MEPPTSRYSSSFLSTLSRLLGLSVRPCLRSHDPPHSTVTCVVFCMFTVIYYVIDYFIILFVHLFCNVFHVGRVEYFQPQDQQYYCVKVEEKVIRSQYRCMSNML